MEQSPREANSFSPSREITRIVWNSRVHYPVHKGLHLTLSWARSPYSSRSHPVSLRSTLILSATLFSKFFDFALTFRLLRSDLVCISPPSHIYLMPLPSHFAGLIHRNNNWWCTNYEAYRIEVFFSLLLRLLSQAHISSKEPYSRRPTASVHPLMWQTHACTTVDKITDHTA